MFHLNSISLILFLLVAVPSMMAVNAIFRRAGHNQVVARIAASPVTLAIWLLLLPVKKIPAIQKLADRFFSRLSDDVVERAFDRIFRDSKNDLRRGDLEAVARRFLPPERYPHMWAEEIPEDLRRPLVVDGRLINGAHPGRLAPIFVDKILVGQAFRRGVLAGIFWAAVGLLAWNPHNLAGEMPAENFASDSHSPQAMVAQTDPAANPLREDVWDRTELAKKIAEQVDLQNKVMKDRLAAIVASAPNGSITAILFGLLVFLGTWRGLVRDAAQEKIEPLKRQSKEAIVRWKYRLEQREMEYQAFLAQLRVLEEFDKSATIDVGRASGVFRYRGQLSAPTKGQPIRFSVQDASQHTLLLGGTGEGKTRTIILPIVSQFLALRGRAKAAGKPEMMSIFGTDGKAVLWRDIRAAAEEAGQGEDVRVIGCDAAAGEFGVDVMDGVDPQLLGDIIRSVMRQAGGGNTGGDDFWPTMASNLIRNAAVIARVWEMTNDGFDLVNRTGERIYSLVCIYQLAVDGEMQTRAVNAILQAIEDPDQLPFIHNLVTPELFDSIRYLRDEWLKLASETRTGIVANVTNAMAPFASNSRLRESFASGKAERLIQIKNAWGAICLVNISSLEFGLAGRIINIMLKTLIYTEARRREMADPKIGLSQKMLFLADEFQDLITAGLAGLSDSNFWNVARSTGVIGFVASQGMASLEQSIGRVAAENFALQMRSKIFLRVEDPATMSLAQKLAGKTLRSYTFSSAHHESFDAMIREEGFDPLESGPARISEDPENLVSTVATGFTQFHRAASPVSFESLTNAFAVDLRFIPSSGLLGHGESGSRLAATQAAHWRAEDKNLQYMTDGNHDVDVLRDEDLMQMGRAHAFVYIQRAGAARMDIAEIG